MCSVQGEINLLCWRTRSIKIPLKVFHLKNPFSENMSHNWHLWLRNWLWRKKKKRSILYKCQQGVQLFPCHNTNRKHLIQCKYTYMIFHFFQWAEQSTLCQKYAGIHAYFIAFYIPLDLSNVFFFFSDKRKFTNVANSVSAQGSTKDLWKCSWIVAKYFNMSQYH